MKKICMRSLGEHSESSVHICALPNELKQADDSYRSSLALLTLNLYRIQ